MGIRMKRIKVCALAVNSCLVLGALAGCNAAKETTTTASESSSAVLTFEETVITAPSASLVETQTDTEPQSGTQTETQNETQEETQNEPQTGNEGIVFDAELQTYVNTFITNFVEQRFSSFDRKTAEVDRYLDFAYMHLKINARDSLTTAKKGDLTYETFTTDKAKEVVGKYFAGMLKDSDLDGLSAPPESFGDQPAGPYYENEKIWYQSADGESVNMIGIVNSALGNSDGTITLYFTVYSIDYETYSELDTNGLRAYYKLTPEKAEADKTLTKVSNGCATVDVGQSGKYFLVSYNPSL